MSSLSWRFGWNVGTNCLDVCHLSFSWWCPFIVIIVCLLSYSWWCPFFVIIVVVFLYPGLFPQDACSCIVKPHNVSEMLNLSTTIVFIVSLFSVKLVLLCVFDMFSNLLCIHHTRALLDLYPCFYTTFTTAYTVCDNSCCVVCSDLPVKYVHPFDRFACIVYLERLEIITT